MESAGEVERSLSRQAAELRSDEHGESGSSARPGDRGRSAERENGSEPRVEHGDGIPAVGA
jgi:hypothetical protein